MEQIPREIAKFFNKKRRIKHKVFVQEAWMPYGINDLPDSHFVSQCQILVNSGDIMELQLNQLDCEVVTSEEGSNVAAATCSFCIHDATSSALLNVCISPPAETNRPALGSPASSAPTLALDAPAKTSTSSHPPLKCSMAGTLISVMHLVNRHL